MLTDCPSCLRSYQVDRAALGANGRAVVCPACDARWYVSAAAEMPSRDGTMLRVATERPSTGRPTAPRGWPAGPRSARRTGLRPLAAAFLGLTVATLLIAERTAIVRLAPRTAALYALAGLPVNVRGLSFGGVAVARLDPDQRVEVSGQIHNDGGSRRAVPRIAVAVRDASGATLATWTAAVDARDVAGHATVAFRTRAPALPPGATLVALRFADEAPSDPRLGTSAHQSR